VPLGLFEGSFFAPDEKFLLTGYKGMQKSALTVKRHFAATFVERWLVNPEVRVKLHSQRKEENTMAAKRKAKAKGKAKKKAKKKGKK
jgi:hypothetical protein